MLIISTRKFREKQGDYLARVRKGEDVIVKSRDNGSFKIVPVMEDDTLMSKKQFFEKIDRSIQQVKEGKVITMKKGQSVSDFLNELCTE